MNSPINRHDTDMILHQPPCRKKMAKGGQAGKGGKITLFFLIKWLKGIIICRFQRLAGTMIGVGLTITLLACLGIFIVSASVSMTKRAISMVPVDWQVLLSNVSSNADAEKVRLAIKKTTSCTALEKVGYADVSGLTASTGDTVQTTGPGKIIGVGPLYSRLFPAEIRYLTGDRQGVLIAQQTAANLNVKKGDIVTIKRKGLASFQVTVNGVVDLPDADSLFQAIGVPKGIAPQAPPDNVLIMPEILWHKIFDPQIKIRPDSVHMQYHVRINHNLPHSPDAAFIAVNRMANNFEARISGTALVGNNLAARLAGVRSDALYARVLFLFLGLPGVILAVFLTLSIAASGQDRLLNEQALLRVRGASVSQILKFEAMEAVIAGAGGVLLGIAMTLAAAGLIISLDSVASGSVEKFVLLPLFCAAVTGFFIAVVSIMYPAWRQAKKFTVSESKPVIRRGNTRLWQKFYLDFFMLAIAGFEYWRNAVTGYQVVIAPEGVAQIFVHYEAFIAPFFLWTGGVLLLIRFSDIGLKQGKNLLSKLLKPVAANLSGTVAASLIRQRKLLIRGMVFVALAVSFAVSTAIFNTTYNVQSHVDADLTNGADVKIESAVNLLSNGKLAEINSLPGITAMQTMMHRFAYVGNDLQDIYGIDPLQMDKTVHMSNAYFAGGNAKNILAELAARPDGILVSEETKQDFQLQEGEAVNLRLQFASDHKYHIVPFQFIGVVREFPTAPKDSFLVANAGYIAEKTGSNTRETTLIRCDGDPALLAAEVKKTVASVAGAKVNDINSVQRLISSNLTSVNLHGLTRVELFFAVLLVMGSTGLILALGLTERRRNFAILEALGAKNCQLDAFIRSEGVLILTGGGITGTLLGLGIAQILVKVLTGVFDPPPDHLFIPWVYMGILAVAAVSSTLIAVAGIKIISRSPIAEELKNL